MKKRILASAVVFLLVSSVAFGAGNITNFQDWFKLISAVPKPTVTWNGVGTASSHQTDTENLPQHAAGACGTSADQSATLTITGDASATGTEPGAALTADTEVGTLGLNADGVPAMPLNTTWPFGSGQTQRVVADGADGTVTQFEGFGASGSQALTREGGAGEASATNRLSVDLNQQAANTCAGASATQSALLDRPGAGDLPALQTAKVEGQVGNTSNASSGLIAMTGQGQWTVGCDGPVAEGQQYALNATQHVDTEGNAGSAETRTNARLDLEQSDAHNCEANTNEQAVVTVSQTASVVAEGPCGSGQVNNSLTSEVVQKQQVD